MSLVNAFKAFFWAFKNPKVFEEATKKIEEKKTKSSFDHLRLLSMMQGSSRFIDFIKEDISGYSDAEVGSAAREIHKECSKLFDELVGIQPLLDVAEGSRMSVSAGFDPQEIRIIGKVKGEPPYSGVLRHPGWKAHKLNMPQPGTDLKKDVLSPAEVEVQ